MRREIGRIIGYRITGGSRTYVRRPDQSDDYAVGLERNFLVYAVEAVGAPYADDGLVHRDAARGIAGRTGRETGRERGGGLGLVISRYRNQNRQHYEKYC